MSTVLGASQLAVIFYLSPIIYQTVMGANISLYVCSLSFAQNNFHIGFFAYEPQLLLTNFLFQCTQVVIYNKQNGGYKDWGLTCILTLHQQGMGQGPPST